MLIVIDKRIPEEAKERLSKFGTLVELSTHNITYPAISCHPDIFLCQTAESLVCAPNLPKKIFSFFDQNRITFTVGINPVGSSFPETSFYNCLATANYLFHKKGHTEEQILEQCKKLTFINLPQAYTRCGLIEISTNVFLTSDKGIEKVLKKNQLEVHYFSPKEIILPTMPHGFIAGALGLSDGKLFILGNPKYHSWEKEFNTLMKKQKLEIISLYDGPFFDGGGIFFLK